MTGFETLGGILNIASIIEVILEHVQDYFEIKNVLELAKEKADNISENLEHLIPLHSLSVGQLKFLSDTVKDFERIHQQLESIEKKVSNRTTLRTVVTSPSTLAQLKEIESKLANKEHNIQVMGMIGILALEHRSSMNTIREEVSNVLVELRSRSIDMQPAEDVLADVCEIKSIEEGLSLKSCSRNDWSWLDSMDPADRLATGISFYNGTEWTSKNYSKAARYFNAALKAGEREANYYLGELYLAGYGVAQCNRRAFEFFEKGAQAGDPPAITRLGYSYIFGHGTEIDAMKGIGLIQKAVEYDDPTAMSVYSWQKIHGYNMDVNYTYGFNLSKRAVEMGNGMAKMNLATCYMHGLGVERNVKEGFKLLKEAMDAGGFSNLLTFGLCYEEGIGVEVDLEKAVEIYKFGSEIPGNVYRRRYLKPFYGLCLIRGRGVEKDIVKGWAQIQDSVGKDNECGWYAQAECYRHGYGVAKNISKAIYSYKRATRSSNLKEGRIRSHYELGTLYESGEGVTQDFVRAFEHYNFSANHLHAKSQWKVALWCESGTGVDEDIVRAAHFFKLAANNGHRDAQIKTYHYYMRGKGVQRNLMKAAQILEPAAENGDREAKRLLKTIRLKIKFRLENLTSWPPLSRKSKARRKADGRR